jgi:hypothetical protein
MANLANIETKVVEVITKLKTWLVAHPKVEIFLLGFFFGFVVAILF